MFLFIYFKSNPSVYVIFLKSHVNVAKFLGVIYSLKRFIKKTTGLVKTTNTSLPSPP